MTPHEASDQDSDQEDEELNEEAGDEDPIRLMANDCNDLFDESLARTDESDKKALPAEVLRFIREHHRRFQGWCSFLGVFAPKQASLDHRLRRHPSLQDMIIRLLDILRTNNLLVAEYDSADGHADFTTGPHDKSPRLPAELKGIFSGIEESIRRLNKLGVIIRSSSRSTVTARARRFATQYPDLVRLPDFEDRAYLSLHCLYPNAPDALRQQLVDSMTDRYAKLSYEAFRTGSMKAPPQTPDKIGNVPDNQDTSQPPDKLETLGTDVPEEQARTADSKAPGPPVNVPASSIDTALVPNIMQQVEVSSVRPSKSPKTLTGHNGRPREPTLPKYPDGEDYTSCEWCHQIVDRGLLHTKPSGHIAWSDEGRRHYRRDLQPYICLAEECREARPAFASSREWFGHMMSEHSERWSSEIHCQASWACSAAHENDTVYAYSTKEELHTHIRHHHMFQEAAGIGQTMTDDPSLLQERTVKISRQTTSCPLCLFSMEEKHSPRNSKELEGPSNESLTTWAMGSHIADHLHHIMIVSLQIMTTIKYANTFDNDTRSQTSGPSTAISGPDENAIQKRLEDLPEDLQGSIDWSDSGDGSFGATEFEGQGEAEYLNLTTPLFEVGDECQQKLSEPVADGSVPNELIGRLRVQERRYSNGIWQYQLSSGIDDLHIAVWFNESDLLPGVGHLSERSASISFPPFNTLPPPENPLNDHVPSVSPSGPVSDEGDDSEEVEEKEENAGVDDHQETFMVEESATGLGAPKSILFELTTVQHATVPVFPTDTSRDIIEHVKHELRLLEKQVRFEVYNGFRWEKLIPQYENMIDNMTVRVRVQDLTEFKEEVEDDLPAYQPTSSELDTSLDSDSDNDRDRRNIRRRDEQAETIDRSRAELYTIADEWIQEAQRMRTSADSGQLAGDKREAYQEEQTQKSRDQELYRNDDAVRIHMEKNEAELPVTGKGKEVTTENYSPTATGSDVSLAENQATAAIIDDDEDAWGMFPLKKKKGEKKKSNEVANSEQQPSGLQPAGNEAEREGATITGTSSPKSKQRHVKVPYSSAKYTTLDDYRPFSPRYATRGMPGQDEPPTFNYEPSTYVYTSPRTGKNTEASPLRRSHRERQAGPASHDFAPTPLYETYLSDVSSPIPTHISSPRAPRRAPRRASQTARPTSTVPTPKELSAAKATPKATEEDARRAGIPAGYSYKNWDPSEEPIMLFGNVFDANSLGKWIYDWTVYKNGPATPIAEIAGELWLLLIQLAGRVKRAEENMVKIRKEENQEILEDFIDSGERLWVRFNKLLKVCEEYMWKAAKRAETSKDPGDRGRQVAPIGSGLEFVDCIFGRDRELEKMERWMAGVRLWSTRFDAYCDDILKNPSA